jgi:hypothetical protein
MVKACAIVRPARFPPTSTCRQTLSCKHAENEPREIIGGNLVPAELMSNAAQAILAGSIGLISAVAVSLIQSGNEFNKLVALIQKQGQSTPRTGEAEGSALEEFYTQQQEKLEPVPIQIAEARKKRSSNLSLLACLMGMQEHLGRRLNSRGQR